MSVKSGTPNDDTLPGSDDADTINGVGGNDLASDKEGGDSFAGETGNDVLSGGEGNDTLLGGEGHDALGLGSGDNCADGGPVSDRFALDGLGNTTIIGGEDTDNIDIDDIDLTGMGAQVTETGPETSIIELIDDFGNASGLIEYSEIEEIIICFTPHTRIATQTGEVKAEDLKAGDKVFTRDNGIQTLRWVGRRDLTAQEVSDHPHLQPILIRAGALGNGLPERDILVSPQHRILLTSELAEMMFGEREVLVAATYLTSLDGVEQAHVETVDYLHLMFDHHEVVLSDGAWSESFQPGDRSLKGIGDEQRTEILSLFPELASANGLEAYGSARPSLKSHEASILVDRLK